MTNREIRIELDYPPSELSPNRRIHFHQKNKIYQAFLDHAFFATVTNRGSERVSTKLHMSRYPLVNIQYVVYPPDNRRRDEDNFLASMKAAQDGIACALGIDDCFFHLKEIIHRPKVRGGHVTAIVTWQAKSRRKE